MNSEPFTLSRTAKPVRQKFPQDKRRQAALFCGLDDSPGQENLFPTDGATQSPIVPTPDKWEAEWDRRRALHASWMAELPADADVDPSRGIDLDRLAPGAALRRVYYEEKYDGGGPFGGDWPAEIQATITILPDNSVLTRDQRQYLEAHTFTTYHDANVWHSDVVCVRPRSEPPQL